MIVFIVSAVMISAAVGWYLGIRYACRTLDHTVKRWQKM